MTGQIEPGTTGDGETTTGEIQDLIHGQNLGPC